MYSLSNPLDEDTVQFITWYYNIIIIIIDGKHFTKHMIREPTHEIYEIEEIRFNGTYSVDDNKCLFFWVLSFQHRLWTVPVIRSFTSSVQSMSRQTRSLWLVLMSMDRNPFGTVRDVNKEIDN